MGHHLFFKTLYFPSYYFSCVYQPSMVPIVGIACPHDLLLFSTGSCVFFVCSFLVRVLFLVCTYAHTKHCKQIFPVSGFSMLHAYFLLYKWLWSIFSISFIRLAFFLYYVKIFLLLVLYFSMWITTYPRISF